MMYGTHLDISDRKRMQAAIERERRFLQQLAKASPVGIKRLDAEGKVVYANRRAETILGVTPSALQNRRYDDDDWPITAYDGSPLRQSDLPFARVRAALATIYGMPLMITWPNGQRRYLSVNGAPLLTSAGRFDGMIATIEDITDREQARQALIAANHRLHEVAAQAEQASRAKSDFLAAVSHEIRTPMNAVPGMDALLLTTELNEEQRHYAETVQQSGELLVGLINDILDIAKIEAGKLDLETLDLDLRLLIDDLCQLMAVRAHQKGLDFVCHVLPDVPVLLQGDPARLRQVLVNLIGNAIKFTHQGEVCLSIDHLAETGPTRRSVWRTARNVARLRGTKCAPFGSPLAPSNATVLVVDDNPTNRQVAMAILRKLGVDTVPAEGGYAALDALATNDFALVLMDVQMHDLDGFETTRRIRARQASVRDPEIPIVAMTAHAKRGDREQCLAAGMNDYLAKPIMPETLRTVLQRWLPAKAAATASTPVPPAVSTDASALWNKALLVERMGGDDALLRDVVSTFLDDMPKQLSTLETLVAQNELAAIHRQAHRIKGSAANINAASLAEIARAVEQAPTLTDLPKRMTDLQNCFKATAAAIRAQW